MVNDKLIDCWIFIVYFSFDFYLVVDLDLFIFLILLMDGDLIRCIVKEFLGILLKYFVYL